MFCPKCLRCPNQPETESPVHLGIVVDISVSTGRVGKVKKTFCILAYLTNGWCNIVHHPISNVKFQMHLQTMVTDLPTS